MYISIATHISNLSQELHKELEDLFEYLGFDEQNNLYFSGTKLEHLNFIEEKFNNCELFLSTPPFVRAFFNFATYDQYHYYLYQLSADGADCIDFNFNDLYYSISITTSNLFILSKLLCVLKNIYTTPSFLSIKDYNI